MLKINHPPFLTRATFAPKLVTSRHSKSSRGRTVQPMFIPYKDATIRIFPEIDGTLDPVALRAAMAEIDNVVHIQ
jgi:hypothetical protein